MPKPSISLASVGRPRVLIVEDEYLIADDLRRLLTAEGYEVVGPTADLAAAAREINRGAISFVVLDLNLGGVLSFELATKLQGVAIPFLFLTGYDPHMVPSRLSAVPCVVKPHEPARVVEMIRHQIGTTASPPEDAR